MHPSLIAPFLPHKIFYFNMEFDFGELKNDTNFVNKINASSEAIKNIEKTLQDAAEVKYEDLAPDEKVTFDLFLVYAVNSLYFNYLKVNGENPSTVSLIYSQQPDKCQLKSHS